MTKPLVITIPTYNRLGFLERAIESVLGQTCDDWVLYIFDDGSTDGTANVVERYEDFRIFYFPRKTNCGLVYTFNEMLHKVCESDFGYWSWLASDDELMPDFVKYHTEAIEDDIDATWSDFVLVNNGVKQRVNMCMDPRAIKEVIPRRVCISLASMCIKVDALRRVKEKFGTFCSEEFKHMNDWDFLMKLSEVTDKFCYINEALAQYHIHPEMGSSGVYFKKAHNDTARQFLLERDMMRRKNV